jgi:hypothetical protein
MWVDSFNIPKGDVSLLEIKLEVLTSVTINFLKGGNSMMNYLVCCRGERRIWLGLLLVAIMVLSLSLAACIGPQGQAGAKGEPGKLAPQPEAALIVIVANKKDVAVAGSGFRPKESIKLVIIGKQGADWGIGPPGGFKANESGAFEVKLTKKQIKGLPAVLIKGVTVYTIKANGLEGSVATAPLIWK